MSANDFQDLLQDAEQMTAQIDKENLGLPRLQRTLSQLFEVNRRKLAKTSNYLSSDANEINASILLAGKGIDTPRLTQTIEGLNAQTITAQPPSTPSTGSLIESMSPFEKFANLDQLRDIDLRTFLKSEKENALMTIIEETRQRTIQEIEEAFASRSEMEWDKQKQKIMSELLGSFNPDMSISSTTTSILSQRSSSNVSSKTRTIMTDIELLFAKEIYLYNERLLIKDQSKPDLLKSLFGLVKKLNDKNIEDAWNMLNYMSNVPVLGKGTLSDYEKELEEHSKTHLDRDNSVKIQTHFVNQAITYLEHGFKEFLQAAVSSNLKQAKMGGALGTLALVTGFLRLSQSEKYHQFSEDIFDDKQPLWPTIYLCIRCGDLEAARNIAIKLKKDDIAGYLDEIIRETVNPNSNEQIRGHLSSTNENKLRLEYKSHIKRANDVYKKAVYCYLCRFSGDDESINEILDNVDDFLWFKLNSIVFTQPTTGTFTKEPSNLGTGSENLTFKDFQTKLSIDFGEKYFTKNRNPFTYLQVLLLTAQFELAIEFLLKYDTMIVHGVHMAIALFEKRLLNIIKSTSSSQLIAAGDASEPKCLRRINFPCLIRMYTRKFECTDPREALQYYYFLRHLRVVSNESKQITNYFAQYISELALETREFELLFGKLEKNAVRRPGIIDKFTSEHEANSIISLVAQEIENKGLVEESIRLYDLCKEHQRVLELCNKLISQVVTEINVPNSNRDRLKTMVTSIAIRYKSEVNATRAIPKSIITTFYLLTDLMTFFDLYHSENWDISYDTLNKLSILPATSTAVDSKVRDFIGYSEEIKRNFPDLILAAMTIISNIYAKINKTSNKSYHNMNTIVLNENYEKRQVLNQLKEHAKALIKFVGCIPYRLSGDINARLLQLEVMLN